MTTYAGEAIMLSHKATFEGANISTGDCIIDIFTSDYSDELTHAAMTYNSDTARWEFLWDTTEIPAGKYNVRVAIILDDATNWEYYKLTLKTNPAASFPVEGVL